MKIGLTLCRMLNTSPWYSGGLLVVHTLRHWGLFVSGAIASVIGWVLYAENIQNLPARLFIGTGGLLLLLAIGRAFHDVRIERDRLAEDRTPKFDIVFSPGDDHDSRPCVQTLEFVKFQIGASGSRMRDRRYRIGVTSLSSVIVPAVQAVVSACIPSSDYIHIGHRLQVMDSDPIVGERDLPPNPKGESTLWFDVVHEYGHESKVPDHFMFCYANPNLVGPVGYDIHSEALSFVITIRVEGGGWTTERQFRVFKEWRDDWHQWERLRMVPL
ncbi:MAG TPA: hypothetical protein VKC35_03590 [Vicinamibacterales bacterium]|nr:hypothetical protein [Vicinamibacterales bacterium]